MLPSLQYFGLSEYLSRRSLENRSTSRKSSQPCTGMKLKSSSARTPVFGHLQANSWSTDVMNLCSKMSMGEESELAGSSTTMCFRVR